MMRSARTLRFLPRAGTDEVQTRRLALVSALAVRFMHDLGLMLTGRRDTFDEYVEAAVLTRLRATVQPFLAGGVRLQPDFGGYAQLIVEGDLADRGRAVTCHVDFEDRSVLVAPDGGVSASRRSLRLTLVTDDAVHTVVAQRLEAR